MPASEPFRYVPNCRVDLDGQQLDVSVRAALFKVEVDLDADLIAQCRLSFSDPQMKLMNGDQFASGTAVRIALGFGATLGQVFEGEIVALEPRFVHSQPPSIDVVCHEVLHRLALSPSTRALNDVDTRQVVQQIANAHGFSADAPNGTAEHVMQANVSDLGLLKRVARRAGASLRLEGKKLVLGAPARSGDDLTLKFGDGVEKVRVEFKAGGQIGAVSVNGWDPRNKRAVTGRAEPQGDTGEGGRSHGDGSSISIVHEEMSPPDNSTAEATARGRMRRLAEKFVQAKIEMIGRPELIPGREFTLDKVGDNVDGKFRVEHALHTFDRRGYRLSLRAVRISKKPIPAPIVPRAQPPTIQYLHNPRWKLVGGQLENPRWLREVHTHGSDAEMRVDARGLDGRSVYFEVEHEASAGSWEPYGSTVALVSHGHAIGRVMLDHPAAGHRTDMHFPAEVDSSPRNLRFHATLLDPGQTEPPSGSSGGGSGSGSGGGSGAGAGSGAAGSGTGAGAAAGSRSSAGANGTGHGGGSSAAGPHGANNSGTGSSGTGGAEGSTAGSSSTDATGAAAEHGSASGDGSADATGAAAAGEITNPSWSQDHYAHGDQVEMHVDASGSDGREIHFIVEQKGDGDAWTRVAEARATVISGHAIGTAELSHPSAEQRSDAHYPDDVDAAPRELRFSASFSDEADGSSDGSGAGSGDASGAGGSVGTHDGSAEGTHSADSAGSAAGTHDGSGPGTHDETRAGSDSSGSDGGNGSTSGSGSADGSGAGSGAGTTAGAAPALDGTGLLNPRWHRSRYLHGDEVEMRVDAHGFDGKSIRFIVEHEVSGRWVQLTEAMGQVVRGVATGRTSVRHPAVAHVRGLHVPAGIDTAAHNLRFRAGHADGPPRSGAGAATSAARAGQPRIAHGDKIEMSVDTFGCEGKTIKFTVEQQKHDGTWAKVAEASGPVTAGKATAQALIQHPAAAQRTGSHYPEAADATPRPLRFHAAIE